MRSLFGKILVFLIVTTLVTMAGSVISRTLILNTGGKRQPPFGLLLSLAAADAQQAYETGGVAGLQAELARFHEVTQAQAAFTDAKGKDLLTGEDRSALIRHRAAGPRLPFVRRYRTAIARRAPSGRYWLIMLVPPRSWYLRFLQPQDLGVLGAVLLLCYGFAYYLTRPLKAIEQAVECFGRGDFSVRANTGRRDELGGVARAFNQMADRIQTLLAAERRLLLDISHEIRSPLTRLNLAIELARSEQRTEITLDRIEKEAGRLNALVTELLDLTRAEGDPARMRHEAVRLDELVAAIAIDCAIECAAKNCSLGVVESVPVEVVGDPELLRRAIENVTRNAIRHTPEGSRVEVHLSAQDEGTVIVVRDYGPGAPETDLAHIFEPFYRVESHRDRASGGFGLGLAIVRRAVQLHGGEVRARNAHPGLELTIQLPAAARPGAKTSAELTAPA